MTPSDFLKQFNKSKQLQELVAILNSDTKKVSLKGAVGSAKAIATALTFKELRKNQLVILSDKEEAAYFYNDLQNLLDKDKVVFFPSSYKKAYTYKEETENANIVTRTDVLNKITQNYARHIIVTYPNALSENVISKKTLEQNTLGIKIGNELSTDFLIEYLIEFGFKRVDFVTNPGEFAIRGGIVDIFSFAHENPYRIELFGDDVDSIREYDTVSQLSINKLNQIAVIPNIQTDLLKESQETFLNYIPKNTTIWLSNYVTVIDRIEKCFTIANDAYQNLDATVPHIKPDELYTTCEQFQTQLKQFSTVEFSKNPVLKPDVTIAVNNTPQPNFNKNFELLIDNLSKNTFEDYTNYIFADNQKQLDRLANIFKDIAEKNNSPESNFNYIAINTALHEGFIDKDLKIACYTDHQIFDRYHRFKLKENYGKKQAISLKEIQGLKPGDYVTHIDHGVGKFSGLEKIDVNGKKQEALRLIYRDNDILYVSIHSLHKIAKYRSEEGAEPKINKIGSKNWSVLKKKTKTRIREVAFNLIKLYAERKAKKGFAFNPDTYLQNELEASFIYEDTPDQLKATIDVKEDMESQSPMDRLICGDVGFGKTEVAIRAAFKAVSDSKQVAVLVPTTILAYQHTKTFKDRLKDFPCRIDYINRFRSAKDQKEILKDLEAGKIDILIGTHGIANKKVKYKDLGLLVIDEEQKFGVGTKDKLKTIKTNVDTLTLTATPIPRTLQFSLMGSRDMSVINTPPPNRHPIITELCAFNEELIRDAITYEVSRNGQVFFVHNRVQNINEVAGIIQRLCPDVKVLVAHGQMKGSDLEDKMLSFINGDYDVLVSTTIIEAGLDIPNANTIIINNANNFGLSDLHQMRGRVGRSNKKAFCYLLTPPLSTLTYDARKRLRAIEEFSDLGSGFNISMRDLDIRGAGDLLGSEQSGFINEMGYETYQKILDEAITELKETEFKDTFKKEEHDIVYIRDCQIDTDFEILLPDYYVESIAERLSLYKELNKCETEEQLQQFETNLIDRFGELPEPAIDLLKTIKLRWLAKDIGFEKVILKQHKLIGHFLKNQESTYFQSEDFNKILTYLQHNHQTCIMKETKGILKLSLKNINSIDKALVELNKILN
jgi:transcription-repair coupling factor (superfamily II helicase)